MKRLIAIVLAWICMCGLSGCGSTDSYEVEIIIPAGSTEAFVYSEEEISPRRNTLEITAWAGITDTEVTLLPVEVSEEKVYGPMYLTQGMPEKMDVEKGAWYKIGVSIQNPSDVDIAVSVKVQNVDIRIALSK